MAYDALAFDLVQVDASPTGAELLIPALRLYLVNATQPTPRYWRTEFCLSCDKFCTPGIKSHTWHRCQVIWRTTIWSRDNAARLTARFDAAESYAPVNVASILQLPSIICQDVVAPRGPKWRRAARHSGSRRWHALTITHSAAEPVAAAATYQPPANIAPALCDALRRLFAHTRSSSRA